MAFRRLEVQSIMLEDLVGFVGEENMDDGC